MTYLYLKEKPLYPFGYGLSYSEFTYDELELDREKYEVSFMLTNTSSISGAEVVQLYFTKSESKYSRPLKKLCGFDRIELASGETKKVILPIDLHSLEAYDVEAEDFVLEKGEYEIYVGKDCGRKVLFTKLMIE